MPCLDLYSSACPGVSGVNASQAPPLQSEAFKGFPVEDMNFQVSYSPNLVALTPRLWLRKCRFQETSCRLQMRDDLSSSTGQSRYGPAGIGSLKNKEDVT